MPLVNGPTLTPRKLAANRANAQPLRKPITLEGLIRMRDSKIKQGAYAQDNEEAARALARIQRTLLTEEIEAWQATRDQDGENLLRTNAPYFRDSAIAMGEPESEVLLPRRIRASGRPGGSRICF